MLLRCKTYRSECQTPPRASLAAGVVMWSQNEVRVLLHGEVFDLLWQPLAQVQALAREVGMTVLDISRQS